MTQRATLDHAVTPTVGPPYARLMRTTRLHVTLREVAPAVVRVVDVPAAATLAEIHELLQSAIGWTDSHLHEFTTEAHQDGPRYGPPDPDLGTLNDTTAQLRDLPEKFVYLYDHGDGWTHDVRVLGVGADRPGCPYGEGTCPPEDSGGPHGHAELLAVLADPTHPDHTRMRDWAGPQHDFEQTTTDRLVEQTAGTVPAPVRLLLDLAHDGITPTARGRLPRAVVRQVQQHRPDWAWSEKPARIEDDLPPLAALHDLLRDTGLLRLNKGALRPIRAATDDLQVLRRLRGWFTGQSFTGTLTTLSVALLCAHGPTTADGLAARILPMLGPGWTSNGHPIAAGDIATSIHRLNSTWRGLDLIDRDRQLIVPGPSARELLPGATRLAHLWSSNDHATTPR